MSAKPLRFIALAVATVVGARAHYRVLSAKRKRAGLTGGPDALRHEQEDTGLAPEVIALYAAIDRHEGFTRAGAHRAFAHLGQEETA